MGALLYRASFFLYEISFFLFALALVIHALSLRKINQSLRQSPYWIWSLVAAGLLLACATNHFYVYHHLSPHYISTQAHDVLILMYVLKTVSMIAILGAGLAVMVSHILYLSRIQQ